MNLKQRQLRRHSGAFILGLTALVLTGVSTLAEAVAGPSKTSLRPPAVPLVTIDPYIASGRSRPVARQLAEALDGEDPGDGGAGARGRQGVPVHGRCGRGERGGGASVARRPRRARSISSTRGPVRSEGDVFVAAGDGRAGRAVAAGVVRDVRGGVVRTGRGTDVQVYLDVSAEWAVNVPDGACVGPAGGGGAGRDAAGDGGAAGAGDGGGRRPDQLGAHAGRDPAGPAAAPPRAREADAPGVRGRAEAFRAATRRTCRGRRRRLARAGGGPGDGKNRAEVGHAPRRRGLRRREDRSSISASR